MEKQIELKPCPFCGNKSIIVISCDEEACNAHAESCEGCTVKSYAYCCTTRKGGCGAASGWHTTISKAKESWNRRVDDDVIDEICKEITEGKHEK